MNRWVGNVLIFTTTVIALELVWRYHRVSGGAWRYTSIGKHVMSFMGIIAWVLLLSTTRLIMVDIFHTADFWWFQALRVISFLGIPIVLLWRRRIIVGAHKNKNPLTFHKN